MCVRGSVCKWGPRVAASVCQRVSVSKGLCVKGFVCYCFLAPLIVWHVCFPVIPVMFRPCWQVLRSPALFAWHV